MAGSGFPVGCMIVPARLLFASPIALWYEIGLKFSILQPLTVVFPEQCRSFSTNQHGWTILASHSEQ
jgi:hypothetical protein